MKKLLTSFQFISVIALLAQGIGCVSTKIKSTEQILTEAGFKPVVASSAKQEQHLKSLPVDKLTVAKLNGKTFYVFPDPAHHQIFVGNLEQYQTYRQVLGYSKIEGAIRLAADEGQYSGADDDKWVEWTNNTGWTYGSD